jgi:hypothetical protein
VRRENNRRSDCGRAFCNPQPSEASLHYVLHFAFCAEPENTNKSDTNSHGIRLEYNCWTISSRLGR